MDSPQKMDIAEWENSPLPIVPKNGVRRRFLPPTLIGILGTLLLHAMLIQSVSFATRGSKPRPPVMPASANVLAKSTAAGDNPILISLPTDAHANQAVSQSPISALPDLSKMKIKPDVRVDSPELPGMELLALSEDQASNQVASDVDVAEQAQLFGIYTGQIQARIDRVWRRPRTPVNENNADAEETFQCEAQIVQDIRGNIQEILLPRCNGSPAWQRSLVLAIQQASPLPAPPSEKVFRSSISFEFVGLNYVAGAPEEDYEPPRQTLLSAQ